MRFMKSVVEEERLSGFQIVCPGLDLSYKIVCHVLIHPSGFLSALHVAYARDTVDYGEVVSY